LLEKLKNKIIINKQIKELEATHKLYEEYMKAVFLQSSNDRINTVLNDIQENIQEERNNASKIQELREEIQKARDKINDS